MGLLLSALISYAGVREAMECLDHIMSGMLPDTEPDFRNFVEYYTMLLQRQQNPQANNWSTQCGQGYLCLNEDKNGILKSAAIKFYGEAPDSAAILFSTKISSFGQDSIDSDTQANGDYRKERYSPARTKTIISNTSESFSVGVRDKSTASEHISDQPFSGNSFERDEREEDTSESTDKLTWHYRPKSPVQPTLPEIHFQSYDDDTPGVNVYNEEFLRSLDGIKFRPLQRSDPSGRRRSFKKRHSSSSTSSRESRASREEELKMFTSLEEAELERTADQSGLGSNPNLTAHSYSRSRSRENSAEDRHEPEPLSEAKEASPKPLSEAKEASPKPLIKDLPKLGSFDEETQDKEKVTEEDLDDFWGNSGD